MERGELGLAVPLRCVLSTETPAPNLAQEETIWLVKGPLEIFCHLFWLLGSVVTGSFQAQGLWSWEFMDVPCEIQTWEMEILLCLSLFEVLWDLWEQRERFYLCEIDSL